MVMLPFGWLPLALYWPIGPVLFAVPVVGSNPGWLASPIELEMAIPGMILISSAASRPASDNCVIMCSFSVVLVWPVSVGTTTSLAATTATSDLVPPTCRVMFGMVTLAPWVNGIARSSHVVNPGADTVSV